MVRKVLKNDLNLPLVSYHQKHETINLIKENIVSIRTL